MREPGYYKVKYHGRWEIAYYQFGLWFSHLFAGYQDCTLDKIGDKIELK